jgi:hypothetical protein
MRITVAISAAISLMSMMTWPFSAALISSS